MRHRKLIPRIEALEALNERFHLMSQEPVLIGAAIVAILNVLVALEVFTLTVIQIGLINTAVAAVFGVFIRSQVTPVNKV